MASWSEIEVQAPELATRAREIFDRHPHKTLASLRRDGSPRVSGTEIIFANDELWVGSMPQAVKALDLRRDPRFALHSASADAPGGSGDAKISGRMEEIGDPAQKAPILGDEHTGGGSHLFRAEISELVVTRVAGDPPDHLVIETWHEGRGVSHRVRR